MQKGLYDPLLRTQAEGFHKWSLLILTLVPWSMFVIVSLSFVLLLEDFAPCVWLLLILGMVVSAILILADLTGRDREKPWFWAFVGLLCVVALGFATVGGQYNYETYVRPFHAYEGRRFYTNVRSTEPPGAHSDAGMLEFTNGTRLQLDHAVGYSDGGLYCVVPVAATSDQTSIGYWAAGVDCCASRGGFACGDAGASEVRSGLVLQEGTPGLAEFRRAARESAAANGLVVAEDPLFLRWVSSPARAQRELHEIAVAFLVGKSFLHLLFSIAMALTRHLFSTRGPRAPVKGGGSGMYHSAGSAHSGP